MRRVTRAVGWMAVLVLGAGGCATGSSVTLEEYSEPKAEIEAAEEIGAEEVPEARNYLEMARQNMAQARRQIEAGDEAAGNRLLMMANADAQLARAYAKAENLRGQVQQVEKQIDQLHRETRGQ